MNNAYLFRKLAITQSWGNSWVFCQQQFHQIVCRMKSLNIQKVNSNHEKLIATSVTGIAMKAYSKKLVFN